MRGVITGWLSTSMAASIWLRRIGSEPYARRNDSALIERERTFSHNRPNRIRKAQEALCSFQALTQLHLSNAFHEQMIVRERIIGLSGYPHPERTAKSDNDHVNAVLLEQRCSNIKRTFESNLPTEWQSHRCHRASEKVSRAKVRIPLCGELTRSFLR